MIYVGIDPGQRNLAMVAINGEGEVVAMAKPLALPLTGVQLLSYLMIFIKDFLDHLPKKYGPVEMICLEGYSNYETFGREMSGEVGATIKLALVGWYGLHRELSYPTLVAPTKLKLFVIGKGSGKGTKKEDVKLWTYKRYGFEHEDNNVVDAYCLAQVARALCNDQLELHAGAERAIKDLKRHTEWSPNHSFKELTQAQTPMTTSPPSESETVPPRAKSQRSSPTRSTAAKEPSSEPSEPTRSIRRLNRASSPATTPAPGTSTSTSNRVSLRRRGTKASLPR